jgi:hypothetical protein
MKNSQISFEFVVLFVFVLFVFLVLANMFPGIIDQSTSTKGMAENLAKDIKVKFITASLSETDFESKIVLPKRINNIDIRVDIVGQDIATCHKDNILFIDNNITGKTIARTFLPIIDGTVDRDTSKFNITIKKANNVLSVIRE